MTLEVCILCLFCSSFLENKNIFEMELNLEVGPVFCFLKSGLICLCTSVSMFSTLYYIIEFPKIVTVWIVFSYFLFVLQCLKNP